MSYIVTKRVSHSFPSFIFNYFHSKPTHVLKYPEDSDQSQTTLRRRHDRHVSHNLARVKIMIPQ